MRQFRILELWEAEFCDSFAFWSSEAFDFATVSHFGARAFYSTDALARHTRLLLVSSDAECCDGFAFWNSGKLNFATVSHFGALEGWNLRQFRILELWGAEFCDSFAFWSSGESFLGLDFATVSHFRASQT